MEPRFLGNADRWVLPPKKWVYCVENTVEE